MTTKLKLGPWTDAENDIHARLYIGMLNLELLGLKFNKAQHRRDGLAQMAASRDDNASRSDGSWEMKACNCSAVMCAAGLPFIHGYKPLGHGQFKPLAAALARALIAHGWSDPDIAALEELSK